VPRNDVRYLRRNALVALGNCGGPEHRAAAAAYLDDPDPMLREHAAWAVARLDERYAGR
jgi:epoxyqueuosine reductase